MPVVNKINYPDAPAGIASCKEKWFKDAFASYWKSQLTSFDQAFLKQAKSVKGFKAVELLGTYVLTGGAPKVTISKADLAALKKADAKIRDGKGIEKLVADAAQGIETESKRIALAKFYASPAFKDGHRKAVYARIKPNKQMAEVLKIKDPKVLKDFQFHMAMGEAQAAQKVAEKHSKAEDMKKKGPALVKKLMQMNNMR